MTFVGFFDVSFVDVTFQNFTFTSNDNTATSLADSRGYFCIIDPKISIQIPTRDTDISYSTFSTGNKGTFVFSDAGYADIFLSDLTTETSESAYGYFIFYGAKYAKVLYSQFSGDTISAYGKRELS